MSKRAKKSQQAEEKTPPTLRGATAQVILLDDAASFSPPEEEQSFVPGRSEGSLSLGQVTVHSENLAQAFSQPPREEKVRALAYDLWLQRGAPIGSPETDWLEAERLVPG